MVGTVKLRWMMLIVPIATLIVLSLLLPMDEPTLWPAVILVVGAMFLIERKIISDSDGWRQYLWWPLKPPSEE
jgi:hypothetical protein